MDFNEQYFWLNLGTALIFIIPTFLSNYASSAHWLSISDQDLISVTMKRYNVARFHQPLDVTLLDL